MLVLVAKDREGMPACPADPLVIPVPLLLALPGLLLPALLPAAEPLVGLRRARRCCCSCALTCDSAI